jgi:hypothetical protein
VVELANPEFIGSVCVCVCVNPLKNRNLKTVTHLHGVNLHYPHIAQKTEVYTISNWITVDSLGTPSEASVKLF